MAATSSSEAVDLEKHDNKPTSCNQDKEVRDDDVRNVEARMPHQRDRGVDSFESNDDGGDVEADGDDPQSTLGRVLSLITSRSSVDPGPPPDGGWLAWSQCVSAS